MRYHKYLKSVMHKEVIYVQNKAKQYQKHNQQDHDPPLPLPQNPVFDFL